MANGEAEIIETIPSAPGCMAHNAMLATLKHGEQRFSDIETKVDAIPERVIQKLCEHPNGAASVDAKFGKFGLRLKGVRPVDMFKIVIGLVGVGLIAWMMYLSHQRDMQNDQRRSEDRRALLQELQGQQAKTIAAIIKEEMEKKP